MKINKKKLLLAFSILLIVSLVANLSIGAVKIEINEIMSILAKNIGFAKDPSTITPNEVVLNSIRLPRILMGLIVGGSLAVCGCCLQALFRNPLADPGLIGVSAGASLGAVIGIYFNTFLMKISSVQASLTISFLAFIFGMVISLLIFKISTKDGKPSVAKMLLCGIAANSLVGAIIAFFTYMSSDSKLRSIAMWGMGNLGESTWEKIIICSVICIVCCIMLFKQAKLLNVFLLGESEAFNLGIKIEKLKKKIIILTSLCVAVCVSFVGPIGFIGLVVPHAVRILIGPNLKSLIPLCFILGSILLTSADLVSRTISMPSEIPIGIITSIIGAPVFVYLLIREQDKVFQ
mgnify:FL=1|tara:strand:+ start:8647 stop:9690 length:1044 start_codon:yes stop_codon:yes gene_type:complete